MDEQLEQLASKPLFLLHESHVAQVVQRRGFEQLDGRIFRKNTIVKFLRPLFCCGERSLQRLETVGEQPVSLRDRCPFRRLSDGGIVGCLDCVSSAAPNIKLLADSLIRL